MTRRDSTCTLFFFFFFFNDTATTEIYTLSLHDALPICCGSNMGGIALPWVADKLNGRDLTILAAEPAACPTLTGGEYRWDFADATGTGPLARTYSLGHDFVPPPIHAGGLRYHGAAPLAGLLRHEGLLDAIAY